MASSHLWLLFAVAGCACKAPTPLVPDVIIQHRTQVETVTRVEKVQEHIAPKLLQCPADPSFPKTLATKQILSYASKLLVVADQCRADLQALGGVDQ